MLALHPAILILLCKRFGDLLNLLLHLIPLISRSSLILNAHKTGIHLAEIGEVRFEKLIEALREVGAVSY